MRTDEDKALDARAAAILGWKLDPEPDTSGVKCPECGVNANRPKCAFELGGHCSRHDELATAKERWWRDESGEKQRKRWNWSPSTEYADAMFLMKRAAADKPLFDAACERFQAVLGYKPESTTGIDILRQILAVMSAKDITQCIVEASEACQMA